MAITVRGKRILLSSQPCRIIFFLLSKKGRGTVLVNPGSFTNTNLSPQQNFLYPFTTFVMFLNQFFSKGSENQKCSRSKEINL
jgi:hypothetical protein